MMLDPLESETTAPIIWHGGVSDGFSRSGGEEGASSRLLAVETLTPRIGHVRRTQASVAPLINPDHATSSSDISVVLFG